MGFLRRNIIRAVALPVLLAHCAPAFSQEPDTDRILDELEYEGYMNLRALNDSSELILTLENDAYKIESEGFAHAIEVIGRQGLPLDKPTKIIATSRGVPQVTMTYNPELDSWKTTSRVKDWNKVRGVKPVNSSFGKVDIVVYPQVSLMNLIITQVYQSLWQISPALEVTLWPGAKFSYQIKIPVFNDGYGAYESSIHPGLITLSQTFRDPWNLNVTGRLTMGVFSNSRFGAALDLKYVFPNERFWLDGQVSMLSPYYFEGFRFHYDFDPDFYWAVAGNFYWPYAKTQFTLRAQKFIYGDVGYKFEMIRHFRHCSVGFYAEKTRYGHTNGGFRFQIALPPYRFKRTGRLPRITTSGQMGLVYNANNEQYYYRESKIEASDNIMQSNSFNPFYIDSEIKALSR